MFQEITSFIKETVKEIEFVDKYRGQLEDVNNYVYPRPAVFVSFGRFEWETTTLNNQLGKGVVRIRTVVENYADAFEGSINQEQALAFFDINEKVHNALQGMSGTYHTPLLRIVDEDDEQHNNLIVTLFEYETTLMDNTTIVNKNYVLTDAELNLKYVNKKDFPKPKPESPYFDTGL